MCLLLYSVVRSDVAVVVYWAPFVADCFVLMLPSDDGSDLSLPAGFVVTAGFFLMPNSAPSRFFLFGLCIGADADADAEDGADRFDPATGEIL